MINYKDKKVQAKLRNLCDLVANNIEQLIVELGIDCKLNGKLYFGVCPVHPGADNISAFNLYPEGEVRRGYWCCRTKHCEKKYGNNLIGLTRGVLSNNEGKTISTYEAIQFLCNLVGKRYEELDDSTESLEKYSFTNNVNYLTQKNTTTFKSKITRDKVRNTLAFPAKYFLDRGYSSAILDKYDVGLCTNPKKEMYSRVVVPIYDNDYQYFIGCTGRSTVEKCPKCQAYHIGDCPRNPSDRFRARKWINNSDLNGSNILYNYWFAKDIIQDTGTVYLVEGPGDVWKMEEAGIHNSVAVLGSSLSDFQEILLETSGVMNLKLAFDNDESGRIFSKKVFDKLSKIYNIDIINLPQGNDISDLTLEQIRNLCV